MGSKKKTKVVAQAEATTEAEPESAVQESNGPTLEAAAASYLATLDADGAGEGTLASYSMELKLAMRELGEKTLLENLTPEQVGAFFECDAVMRTKQGKPKAKPTFDKSRRVLRLCLLHAQDAGLIAVAPLPVPAPKTVKLQAV